MLMPTVLLTLAACAPVTRAESSTDPAAAAASNSGAEADAGTSADAGGAPATDAAAGGGQPPAEGAPRAVAGSPGTGEVQPVPPEQILVGPGLGDDSCKADAAQGFVGRNANEAVVKDAVRASGAKTARVIPHNGMVTMDYRGDRLNIQLDEQGKIVAITCG
jgi:hypothetical protein